MDKYRVQSVLDTATLEVDIEKVDSFDLTALKIENSSEIVLPTNLRLGHIIEKVFAHFIQAASNFEILYENLQIIDQKRTLGELDFIVKDLEKNKLIHVEVAYKFYLLDPSLSNAQSHCWIGPNRNDSFVEKITKMREKQFPILYHKATVPYLQKMVITEIQQALCFMANLFLPMGFKGAIEPKFQGAVKGYYLPYGEFLKANHSNIQYHIPVKKLWGIAPKTNSNWSTFEAIKADLTKSIAEKQAPLLWVKTEAGFEEMFLVWW
ncbi:DUF1853 domain-containing protein [Putridiphycobacter roseus]|uniref:DUF1853 domain-containing protein n=1 Tax=Putridiphycobacter roseus TaxID=2219161 RepID=A0A2W1NLM8_9FLAO|nr:DUF1853 family protein [Putridiphycobacter roseus]PZE16572.1 DUF1853 domain-containing protein [Putridiphycobacter roseus]